MGKLNFCKPCGEMRVRDAKEQMEKLMTKKEVAANRCGFCNKTISTRIRKSEATKVQQEPGVKRSSRLAAKMKVDDDGDVSVDDDAFVDIKIECVDVEMEDGGLDAHSQSDDGSDDNNEDDYVPEGIEEIDDEDEGKGEVMEGDDKTGIKRSESDRFIEKTLLAPDVLELVGNQGDESGFVACIFCQKEFDNVGKFLRHAASHTKNARIAEAYMCSICNKRFNRVQGIKTHLRGQHDIIINNKPAEICTLCNKVSSRKNWLARHMETTHGEKEGRQPFKCSHLYCDREFKDKRDLVRHEMIHTGVRPYVCETCGRGFIRGEDLRAHVRVHSGDYIYCTMCTKFKTTKERTLKRHMKDIHLEKKERKPIEKNHMCELCGGAYPTNAALRRHKMVHSDIKPFRCTESNCDYGTAFKMALKKHVDAVHLKLKPYKCRHCDKSFALTKSRLTHERIHTGERPYVCDKCGKDFNRKDGLRFHMKLHTAEYKFECELCGYRAIRNQTLKRHYVVKHSGNSDIFTCDTCSMSFASAQSLKMHKRLHKDGVQLVEKKRFHCDKCDFSSDVSRNVTKHAKRLHLQEATFECGHCRKKFRTRAKCEDHMNKFHLKYFSPGSYIHQEEPAKDIQQQEPSPEVATAVEMIKNAAEGLFPVDIAINPPVSSTAETLIQQDTVTSIPSTTVNMTTLSTTGTVSTMDEEDAILALGLLPEGIHLTHVLKEVTIPTTNGQ